MSEDSPFASFVPSIETPTPPPAGKPAKKPRKNAKKAAAPAAENSAPAPKAPKTPKKPRTNPRSAGKKARAIKIDLAVAMTALSGLQEGDAKFVMSVVQALQPFAKKQRARIIEALGKVFA